MPEGIVPTEGAAELLAYILKRAVSGVLPWELMLWTNDIFPDAETVLADLEEATFPGYERATLTRSVWTEPTAANGCAVASWNDVPLQWTVSGPTDETVFGFALVDTVAEVIRFVQRFDAEDLEELSAGKVLRLLPLFTLTSAACPEV